MDGIEEFLSRWADYFWSLPAWLRTTLLVLAGVTLTISSVKRFQDETVMALAYLALAVLFFWVAISRWIFT